MTHFVLACILVDHLKPPLVLEPDCQPSNLNRLQANPSVNITARRMPAPDTTPRNPCQPLTGGGDSRGGANLKTRRVPRRRPPSQKNLSGSTPDRIPNSPLACQRWERAARRNVHENGRETHGMRGNKICARSHTRPVRGKKSPAAPFMGVVGRRSATSAAAARGARFRPFRGR